MNLRQFDFIIIQSYLKIANKNLFEEKKVQKFIFEGKRACELGSQKLSSQNFGSQKFGSRTIFVNMKKILHKNTWAKLMRT